MQEEERERNGGLMDRVTFFFNVNDKFWVSFLLDFSNYNWCNSVFLLNSASVWMGAMA